MSESSSATAPARDRAGEPVREDPPARRLELHQEPERGPLAAGEALPARGPASKRLFDLTVALAGLVLALPLIIACGIAVLLSSGWPVIFRQERVGLHGRHFRCLKFRTMVRNAEQLLEDDPRLREAYRNGGFKLHVESDPRVTRVGAFLRRSRLDELPQLWNVVRGDLSLVGPRPLIPEEVGMYGSRRPELLGVRPGVFGAWTRLGARRPGYPERADVELDYIRTRSFVGDVRILLGHVPVLLRREGAEG